ncbi:hypothetical protein A2704_05055 [Candidatus Kaiserbacteria bacterium RIFCSPHIGHO2_01_FULL_54_36b]|uniref:3-deoxy-D-manno-octulosonate 8-phosphate phosphatase n=1 Tax=Candidatus Kaiserbacteria bacterium RIFCSPHIGHO2_01_FULL_54_36b TaxID=1798483 RepID=A0A1F6CNE0_9BACT|nr:MAG: hypothetical protein A2704_05055 [Candidatus Kaiserbacteria bacterium RIFCSPHIGHO2_01_FULL_54_36b]
MATPPSVEILRTFKGLILDGDGVWFTGDEFRATLQSGEVVIMKQRCYPDGQGLSFLRAIGVSVLFATAEKQPLESIVERLNGLPSVQSGAWRPIAARTGLRTGSGKVPAVEEWLTEQSLTWQDCAYIGDDRNDIECMQKAGLAVTPSDGQRVAKKVAHLVLSKPGGSGAIREFAEMVLDARDVDERTLPFA